MVIAYATDDKSAEMIARELCVAYNMQIGFATWGLSKSELLANTHVGCVSYAHDIGVAIRASDAACLTANLEKVMTVREICNGKIVRIELKQEGGFDFGVTKILGDDGETYSIDFKNENMIVRNGKGDALITVPEIICLVDLDTMTPMTNAETSEGMRLGVYASPAHPLWWSEDCKAYECWRPILETIGYTGKLVKYE
jgi:DUF917 family protein